MMDTQLTLTEMIKHTEKYYDKKKVISRTHSGVHMFTYKETIRRMRQLSSALESLGLKKGTRLGHLLGITIDI